MKKAEVKLALKEKRDSFEDAARKKKEASQWLDSLLRGVPLVVNSDV
jgi:hypothetical protein